MIGLGSDKKIRWRHRSMLEKRHNLAARNPRNCTFAYYRGRWRGKSCRHDHESNFGHQRQRTVHRRLRRSENWKTIKAHQCRAWQWAIEHYIDEGIIFDQISSFRVPCVKNQRGLCLMTLQTSYKFSLKERASFSCRSRSCFFSISSSSRLRASSLWSEKTLNVTQK